MLFECAEFGVKIQEAFGGEGPGACRARDLGADCLPERSNMKREENPG